MEPRLRRELRLQPRVPEWEFMAGSARKARPGEASHGASRLGVARRVEAR